MDSNSNSKNDKEHKEFVVRFDAKQKIGISLHQYIDEEEEEDEDIVYVAGGGDDSKDDASKKEKGFRVIVTSVNPQGQASGKVNVGDEIIRMNSEDDHVSAMYPSYDAFLKSLRNQLMIASSSTPATVDADGIIKNDDKESSQGSLNGRKRTENESDARNELTLTFLEGAGLPVVSKILKFGVNGKPGHDAPSSTAVAPQEHATKNPDQVPPPRQNLNSLLNSFNSPSTSTSSASAAAAAAAASAAAYFSSWSASSSSASQTGSKTDPPTTQFGISSLTPVTASISKNYANFVKKISHAASGGTASPSISGSGKRLKEISQTDPSSGIPSIVTLKQSVVLPKSSVYFQALKKCSHGVEQEGIEKELETDWDVLQHFCFQGIPDESRSIAWKLLLRYLPLDSDRWKEELNQQRELYEAFKKQFIVVPKAMLESENAGSGVEVSSRPTRLHGQAWWEYEPPSKDKMKKSSSSDSVKDHGQTVVSEIPPPIVVEDGGVKSDDAVVEDSSDGKEVEKSVENTNEASQGNAEQVADVPDSSDSAEDGVIALDSSNKDAGKTPRDVEDKVSESPREKEDDKEGVSKTVSVKELEGTAVEDDPLNTAASSEWNSYFENTELREEIWKDVQRTNPGFHFFTHDNYVVMERILFIYAKLNPGVRYVQGMNEILAPIYFVMKTDESGELFQGHAEADTFFCFTNLMGEIRDLFIGSLDGTETGLRGRLAELSDMIARVDPELGKHFEDHGIVTQFFAIRWLTTLLSREFILPDTLRVWDSLFSDPKRFRFLLHVACAMIVLRRDELLQNDFAFALNMLQNYEMSNVDEILRVASEIHKMESL